LMAIGAMRAIQQASLNVPGDISVTGFDNIELAAYVTPALTTFNQPKYELGSNAATMMLRVLNDEMVNSQSDVQVLRGTLVPRQSTSKPSDF
jgi:DNA-binding LacI/PurR family transcriptional regulator